MMELPPPLVKVFRQDMDKIQEESRMPYVTSIERLARREGMREGIESLLRARFGEEGLKCMPDLDEIHEEEQLRAILKALETAASLDEVPPPVGAGSPVGPAPDVGKVQGERRMPFITTPERVGRREGLREGIEALLRVRFGDEGLRLMSEICDIHEEEKLRAILRALETASSPDEVRRLWAPPAP
jgi:hypothetical protein